eukprot:scaffold147225_cov36-Prasinocladus_malaysianus.AAC.1
MEVLHRSLTVVTNAAVLLKEVEKKHTINPSKFWSLWLASLCKGFNETLSNKGFEMIPQGAFEPCDVKRAFSSNSNDPDKEGHA